MSTTTRTHAELGRARAMAYLTNPKNLPAGYRALTEAEAADTTTVDGQLELLAGVGLVVKLAKAEDHDLVADLQATTETAEAAAEQLATLTREALEASREAGVQVGRYTSGASSRPQLDQAQHRADQAAQAMWRAFYTFASY